MGGRRMRWGEEGAGGGRKGGARRAVAKGVGERARGKILQRCLSMRSGKGKGMKPGMGGGEEGQ